VELTRTFGFNSMGAALIASTTYTIATLQQYFKVFAQLKCKEKLAQSD
jgi:hypothetical protein